MARWVQHGVELQKQYLLIEGHTMGVRLDKGLKSDPPVSGNN